MQAINLKNQRFGRLVAKRPIRERRRGQVVWECECDCGNIKKATAVLLRSGGVRSCGCLRKESASKTGRGRKTHGHTGENKISGTYHSWQALKTRCSNINHIAYKRYGGRGITVCERWLIFENFLADMGEKPGGLTLERIDNDGNYELDNCKWATRQEQTRNSIQTKLAPLEVQVIKKLLKESGLTQKDIGEIFNVTAGAIAQIKVENNWKEIEQ